MLKLALVAPVRPEVTAASAYPFAGLSRLRFEKVATPLTAATDVVPERVPPTGLLLRLTVTVPVKLGVTFPNASWALTWTAGPIGDPTGVLDGWTLNASRLATAGVMLKPPLVAPLSPAALAASV